MKHSESTPAVDEDQAVRHPSGLFTPVRVAFWCTLLFVVALVPVAWMMDQVLQANATDRIRLEMAIRMERYSDAITAAMNRRLTLISALSTFVRTHQSTEQFDQDLQLFTSGLFSTVDGLVSVRVIKGQDVRVVFPTTHTPTIPSSNTELERPGSARFRALARAIQTRRITVVDPEPGLIDEKILTTYLTVYNATASPPETTLSISFELGPILREVGLETTPDDLRLVLRTSSGRAFFGQPIVYEQDPVISDLDGDGFSWELAAIPRKGWNALPSGEYRMLRAAGLSITLLLAVLVYLIVGYQERLKSNVRHRTLALREANQALQQGVAERQAALDELQETSFALSHAMPGIARLDAQADFEHVNETFADLFGKSPKEWIGYAWHNAFDSNNAGPLCAAHDAMKQTGNGEFEVKVPRKDGTHFYCEGLLVRRKENDPEALGGCLLYVRDITDRKAQEKKERTLYENLARARRMESIGKLAGGVAHDLNNILGPLVAYPDLILAELPPDHPVCPDVITIRDASMSAKNVIQDLLTLARRGRVEHQVIDLNHAIDEYLRSANLRELQSEYPAISLETSLAADPLLVKGSKSQLQQVLLNLITNAFEAISHPGTVTVSTCLERVDEDRAASHDATAGDHVLLTITDSGEGIDPTNVDLIFEPFFSTKEMGRSGTGLGLTVTYGVVRDHHGFIEVDSKSNEGATFRIYLPVAEVEMSTGPTEPIVIPRGSEKVLVVDDRDTQRELATRLLTKLGYQVDCAEHGHAALLYLKSNRVDLVVLDMIMEQGFDGLDTYQAIRELNPDQRCLIASGYAANDRVKKALSLGVRAYLPKPYTQENIGILTRQVLDQPNGDTDHTET